MDQPLLAPEPPPMDAKRIKRKPAPSLHWSEKYPPPDPTDPFAPLWVLRNRSSALLASPSSFTLYPDIQPNVDIVTPMVSPASAKRSRESHYRRRSQSFAPSTDSGSDEGGMARFIPRKESFASLKKRSRKISTSSISNPTPIASELHPKLQTLAALDPTLYPRRPIKTFDLKPAPELDPGFVSEPECLKGPLPAPTTATSSTLSDSSSSYINISAPSSSHEDGESTSLYSAAHKPPSFPFRRIANSKPKSAASSSIQTEWELPTEAQLSRASTLPVITQSGIRVPFGSLFVNQRTIVIFIRHFWCPLCQDYIASLTSLVDPKQLFVKDKATGLIEPAELVVVSNGSHSLIQKYKQIFGMEWPMYTDPSLAVYEALGMRNVHEACARSSRAERSAYVRRGPIGGLTMVVLRALRVGMPVWERGGDIHQLGGEFVLGPGLTCVYAHRMQSAQGHTPIMDVLDAAGAAGQAIRGVMLPAITSAPVPPSVSLPKQTHKRTAKIRLHAASRSVLDIPSSDSEVSLVRKRQSMSIPQIIRTSATWDGLSSITSDEFSGLGFGSLGIRTKKRQSVSLSAADREVRKSLSLAVSVAVKGHDEEDQDLVVLFEDTREKTHA